MGGKVRWGTRDGKSEMGTITFITCLRWSTTTQSFRVTTVSQESASTDAGYSGDEASTRECVRGFDLLLC